MTQLVAPGHDKLVPPEFFLKEHPTILEAELVPMRSFDRTVESFETRRRKPARELWSRLRNGRDPLKVTGDPGPRRAILANLLYPLTAFRSERERPLDYAIVALRSHHQGSSST